MFNEIMTLLKVVKGILNNLIVKMMKTIIKSNKKNPQPIFVYPCSLFQTTNLTRSKENSHPKAFVSTYTKDINKYFYLH